MTDPIKLARDALEWINSHRLSAIARIDMAECPEDAEVKRLCEQFGYGAVMDSASRQWGKKEGGRTGAFFVGGCLGDTSASDALAAQTRRDAQMRAEGMRAAADVCNRGFLPCDIGGDLILDADTGEAIQAAILALAAQTEEAANG